VVPRRPARVLVCLGVLPSRGEGLVGVSDPAGDPGVGCEALPAGLGGVVRFPRVEWYESVHEPVSWARCECGWSAQWTGTLVIKDPHGDWYEHDGYPYAAAEAHKAGHAGERRQLLEALDRSREAS